MLFIVFVLLVNSPIMEENFDTKIFQNLPLGGAVKSIFFLFCAVQRPLVVDFENVWINFFLS